MGTWGTVIGIVIVVAVLAAVAIALFRRSLQGPRSTARPGPRTVAELVELRTGAPDAAATLPAEEASVVPEQRSDNAESDTGSEPVVPEQADAAEPRTPTRPRSATASDTPWARGARMTGRDDGTDQQSAGWGDLEEPAAEPRGAEPVAEPVKPALRSVPAIVDEPEAPAAPRLTLVGSPRSTVRTESGEDVESEETVAAARTAPWLAGVATGTLGALGLGVAARRRGAGSPDGPAPVADDAVQVDGEEQVEERVAVEERVDAVGVDAEQVDAEQVDAEQVDAEQVDAEQVDSAPVESGPVEPVSAEAVPVESGSVETVPGQDSVAGIPADAVVLNEIAVDDIATDEAVLDASEPVAVEPEIVADEAATDEAATDEAVDANESVDPGPVEPEPDTAETTAEPTADAAPTDERTTAAAPAGETDDQHLGVGLTAAAGVGIGALALDGHRADRAAAAEPVAAQPAAAHDTAGSDVDVALLRTFGVDGVDRGAGAAPAITLAGVPEPVVTARSGAGAQITVRVVDRSGAGVPDAMVGLVDDRGRESASARTDGDGTATVRTPRPGTFMVVASAAAYQPGATAVEAETTQAQVLLLRSSSIAGSVWDEAGALLGARLVLEQDDEIVETAVSGGDGGYRFAEVPAGAYRLTATAPGHAPSSATLTVADGDTLRHEFDLDASGSR